MNQSILLGIDLGTSSVKIIAMTEKGQVLAEESSQYPVDYPHEQWAEQSPELWWHHTLEAMNRLTRHPRVDSKCIKGIGLSGQMHGLVVLDHDNQVLTPAILWCDQRTMAECDTINEAFPLEKLKSTVSNQALPGFTAPKLLWLKNHQPKVFERIHKIMLPKDYLRYKLTGVFATDFSDASGTLLLDIENKCWSQEMCDFIGISSDQLPPLYESYQMTGKILPSVAEQCQLTRDVIVAAGAGDQAAGAVGSGAVEDGIITVTLGTSGVVFASHDPFKVDDKLRLHAFCHANGGYHSMGVMLSAASALKWWSDEVNAEVSLDDLIQEAENNKLKDNLLIFLPYLLGERTPYVDPYVRGTFLGLSPTSNRGQMTQALLEGVSYGLKDSLNLLIESECPIGQIRVIGGGSKSDYWLQLLSNILDYPLYRINTDQGGALGAAILASVACGIFESVGEASQTLIKVTDRFKPNAELKDHFSKKYSHYKSAYQAIHGWYKDCLS